MTNNDLIQQRFPNKILLTLRDVCQILGISTQTAHNRLSQGRFVLTTIKEANRTYVHVNEMVEYLNKLEADCAKPATRRGRPTKAEQKARQAASSPVLKS